MVPKEFHGARTRRVTAINSYFRLNSSRHPYATGRRVPGMTRGFRCAPSRLGSLAKKPPRLRGSVLCTLFGSAYVFRRAREVCFFADGRQRYDRKTEMSALTARAILKTSALLAQAAYTATEGSVGIKAPINGAVPKSQPKTFEVRRPFPLEEGRIGWGSSASDRNDAARGAQPPPWPSPCQGEGTSWC